MAGIEAFLRREVLPHAANPWCLQDSFKTGYDLSFTPYFYKVQRPHTILALEKGAEGPLGGVIEGGA